MPEEASASEEPAEPEEPVVPEEHAVSVDYESENAAYPVAEQNVDHAEDAEAVAENETATDSAMTDATGHSEQEPERTARADSA